MVYRRRRLYRRRRFGRRRYSRRTKTIARVARRVVRRMAETNRLVGALNTGFGAVTTAWSWTRFAPAQGSASTSRIGRVCYLHGLTIHGTLAGGQSNSTLDDPTNQFRIHVGVWDPDVATPPCGTLGVQDLLIPGVEPRNLNASQLKRTLFDKTYLLQTKGRDSTGYLPVQRQIKIHLRFKKPIKMSWTDEATSYPNKYVYLQMVSDSIALPSPGFVSGYYIWTYKEE